MRRSHPHKTVGSLLTARTEHFYERMDELMHELWGDHLHHGLWCGGIDDHESAARRLVSEIGRRLRLAPGARVLDVGCGYGATGVQLGVECGLQVEGITISQAQKVRAVEGARVAVADWLSGGCEDESMDAVIAIESLEHMADPELAVRHIARVLRPGGRVVLACWVQAEETGWWERVLWLEPIRRAGCLWGQGSERRLLAMLQRAGFTGIETRDFSRRAAPTWRHVFRRAVGLVRTRPGLFWQLGWRESLSLGLATLRIMTAYRMGLLRYVVIEAVG